MISEWNEKQVLDDMTKRAAAGVKRMTLAVEREVKLLIAKKGIQKLSENLSRAVKKFVFEAGPLQQVSGRHKVRRIHSKPGQPPFRQTGTLVSSYGHEFHEGGLLGICGSNQKTARWLELGTSKMQPRPHLRRSFDKVVNDWRKNFEVTTT